MLNWANYFFEVFDIKELNNEWRVVLHEKFDMIPSSLQGKTEIILDGFCNPISLLSHCLSLKPIYLELHRRRWKESGKTEHFSNQYALTKDASKLTANKAGFLKI